MRKANWNRLFIGTVAVVTVCALGVGEALAFGWGSSSSGSSSSGSWGSSSSGSSSSGSWGSRSSGSWGSSSSGSSGSWGGHRYSRVHRRWGSSGSWGSSSSGSSGSSSSGSWGSSSSGSSGAAPANGATTYRSSSATLAVKVPEDAKVVVNGAETRSTGADRRYVSNGLQPGRNYTYKVDATFYRGGKPVTETKTVQLTAGATANLVFGDSQSQKESTVSDSKNNDTVAQAPVETKLTVTVPADAKVFLSGSPTRMTGDTRTYTTTKLARGQDWPNYVVRVEVDQDGQKLSQERTITLTAGANQQLTFQFDADKVASATR